MPAFGFFALQFLIVSLPPGNVLLDRPLVIGDTDATLMYDDGTGYWLSWEGLYRGVWFNLEDFGGRQDFWLENLEFWFYHHSSYPWDTSAFYGELYDGSPAGPENLLNQTSVTALHLSPCFAEYPWPGNEQVFQHSWALVNTQMSSGGWPSLLGDGTPNTVSHSFFSDDFIVWEPWVVTGPDANDFLIRENGTLSNLNEATWASIKTLF